MQYGRAKQRKKNVLGCTLLFEFFGQTIAVLFIEGKGQFEVLQSGLRFRDIETVAPQFGDLTSLFFDLRLTCRDHFIGKRQLRPHHFPVHAVSLSFYKGSVRPLSAISRPSERQSGWCRDCGAGPFKRQRTADPCPCERFPHLSRANLLQTTVDRASEALHEEEF